jgi:hypothetical protein
MKMRIITPGGEVSYNIPVLKVKDYSVKEIFDKELYFIIPFHIFVYESKFPSMEKNPDMLKAVQEEYAGIVEQLEEALRKGKITEFDKKAICIMSERVLKKIADKQDTQQSQGVIKECKRRGCKKISDKYRAHGYAWGVICCEL